MRKREDRILNMEEKAQKVAQYELQALSKMKIENGISNIEKIRTKKACTYGADFFGL